MGTYKDAEEKRSHRVTVNLKPKEYQSLLRAHQDTDMKVGTLASMACELGMAAALTKARMNQTS